jgi:DNA-binding response OmpR family regulator
MQRSRSALVVAATPALARKLCAWLKWSGWNVITAHSYAAAKVRLEHHFSLLVTELELGDYNGLQLALRAQACNVPALVIGRHDAVLERDAEQLGSTYVRKDELDQHRFLIAVDVKLEATRRVAPLVVRNLEFIRRPWTASDFATVPRRLLLH